MSNEKLALMLSNAAEVVLYEKVLDHYTRQAHVCQYAFKAGECLDSLKASCMSAQAAAVHLYVRAFNNAFAVEESPLLLRERYFEAHVKAPKAMSYFLLLAAVLPSGHAEVQKVVTALKDEAYAEAIKVAEQMMNRRNMYIPSAFDDLFVILPEYSPRNFGVSLSLHLANSENACKGVAPGVIQWFPILLDAKVSEQNRNMFAATHAELCTEFQNRVMAFLQRPSALYNCVCD